MYVLWVACSLKENPRGGSFKDEEFLQRSGQTIVSSDMQM